MRRGRPKHPDLLTPREWDVLLLLREGLTNEQIATRLGISHNGAKYHVGEILSKLGYHSREDAAVWRPELPRRRLPVLILPFLQVWQQLRAASWTTVGRMAAFSLIVATLGLLAVLILGTLVMEQRRTAPEPPAQTTIQTASEPAGMESILASFVDEQGFDLHGSCEQVPPPGSLCYQEIAVISPNPRLVHLFLYTWQPGEGYVGRFTLVLEPGPPGSYLLSWATGQKDLPMNASNMPAVVGTSEVPMVFPEVPTPVP